MNISNIFKRGVTLPVFSILIYSFLTSSLWAEQSTQLNEVVVVGKLDKARQSIAPSLGATEYNINHEAIDSQSQGNNASFNQVILRAPGAAEDSFGQLHIRGEHANLQYRINDVLLPEGISGFGQELDTRFVDNVSLITGSLPAQYGFRTAGIVDIHTPSGVFNQGGNVSLYGGSHNTINPSLTYGGSDKGINYYVTASYLENTLGIENPTKDRSASHDQTQQGKAFAYVSKVIDDTSRLSVMLSGSHGDFEIPNNPGQDPDPDIASFPAGFPTKASEDLNERQTEQNYYTILTYQKALDDLNFQISAFNRDSEVLFRPDINGDLYFNGTASHVDSSIMTNGLQLDGSYILNDTHTLRGGSLFSISTATNDNTSYVFPVDGGGNASDPIAIVDNHQKQGQIYGLYLQDEWKALDHLTINYGGRFDQAYQYINEYQFSPRVNAVYEVDKDTTVHAGYARYFTPPPLDRIQNVDTHLFDGTSNELEVFDSSPVKAERSHAFDIGVTHNVLPELKVGVDAYYKMAKNQLDEGQFGQALVFSPFNYEKGKVYGIEFTANYAKGGFSAYHNIALGRAYGKNITSGEFQFGQDELDYSKDHWVHLDHEQIITGSAGLSYKLDKTKVYADLLYGSGLRKGDFNLQHTGFYNPVNVGIEHTFNLSNFPEFKARFDVVNVFDEAYQLRDGSGIGVGAPQFGQRRGFYGGLSMNF